MAEGADAMSYYNALQFTAPSKLATMCPALSFSVNPFAAAHAAPPFENDYRPEKSQWRNWSQCPCRRRSSHSCIHSPHSSLSEGCSLDSSMKTAFHFQILTLSGLLLNVTLLVIVHLFCTIVWPSPAQPPPCPPSVRPDPEWME